MSRRNDRDGEEEFQTPSCQCLHYKEYCSCIYPVYAHASTTNYVNNIPPPVEMADEEETSSTTESLEDPMRTIIFCQQCELNYELTDFVSNEHNCYRLPVGFNIEPIIGGGGENVSSETNTDLVCSDCQKHYSRKKIHCNQCHSNYILTEFRDENHKCFAIPKSLKIQTSTIPLKRKMFEKEVKNRKKIKKRRPSSPVEDVIYFSSEPSDDDLIFENIGK